MHKCTRMYVVRLMTTSLLCLPCPSIPMTISLTTYVTTVCTYVHMYVCENNMQKSLCQDLKIHKCPQTQSHRCPRTQSHRCPQTQSHKCPQTQSHRFLIVLCYLDGCINYFHPTRSECALVRQPLGGEYRAHITTLVRT